MPTTLLWDPPWLPRGRAPALQTFAPGRTWITTGCTKSCLPGCLVDNYPACALSWSLFLHVWLDQPGSMTKWKVRKWICWVVPAMRTQAEVSDRGRIPWMVPQPALGLKTLRIWELLLTHWCRHSCSENLDISSGKLNLLVCSHFILNWSILNCSWNNCF